MAISKKMREARSRELLKKQVGYAKAVDKKRKRKPNRLRVAKQYWYELEAYFDPHEIKATPVSGGGFILGILEDFVVVEIPKDKTKEDIYALGQYLAKVGLKALIVQAGIRFLRLTEVDKKKASELEEILVRQKATDERQKELDKKIAEKYGPAGEAEKDSSTEVSDTDG